MDTMKKISTRRGIIALIIAALMGLLLTSAPASAATASCTNTEWGWPSLHAYFTRINYGNGKTAIYASANQSVRKDNPAPFPDVTYTFNRFSSPSGLQTRYSNPTQWGNKYNPLNTAKRTITVTWKSPGHVDRNCTAVVY